MSRYTPADLRFIAARVLAEVRATPATGPLLGTPEPRARASVCKRGHVEAGRTNGGHCRECERERKQRARRGR